MAVVGFPFFVYNFILRNNEIIRDGWYLAKFRMFCKTENMRNFVSYCFSKRKGMQNFVPYHFAKQKKCEILFCTIWRKQKTWLDIEKWFQLSPNKNILQNKKKAKQTVVYQVSLVSRSKDSFSKKYGKFLFCNLADI
jgi:hypothetical protein